MRIRKTIKVGREIEVEQGSCMVNHRISSPFDSMSVVGITEGRLYEILESADSIKVISGNEHEKLDVKVGILEFTVYQKK